MKLKRVDEYNSIKYYLEDGELFAYINSIGILRFTRDKSTVHLYVDTTEEEIQEIIISKYTGDSEIGIYE